LRETCGYGIKLSTSQLLEISPFRQCPEEAPEKEKRDRERISLSPSLRYFINFLEKADTTLQ
jgi:hypothetical protein